MALKPKEESSATQWHPKLPHFPLGGNALAPSIIVICFLIICLSRFLVLALFSYPSETGDEDGMVEVVEVGKIELDLGVAEDIDVEREVLYVGAFLTFSPSAPPW